ncbi:hypothetical protein [Wolbachia endosymbiont of Ctenocephalides felis wCfeT]|uniref:hypothetical protein n=1 Tax=Wolbachia endosymbiont of Ctenocephalides felis wCfeT TaxID=2732593 RepID=UPI001447BB88|nr:hypothetical protein [Wolbachia endosymbiont of Ctenocephalides felis wCfeT]
MQQGYLTAENIKKYDFSDISAINPYKAKFGFELSNGAKCDLDGDILSCTYSAKSNNPFHRPAGNSDEDYRFMDEIRLEGIKLKKAPQINCPANDPEKCLLNKLKFTFNGKVEYKALYPTYSNTIGEVSTTTNANGISTVYVKNFSEKTNTKEIDETNKGIFSFVDVEKGGTQAIIKFEEDTFRVQNQGFGNLGSRFIIESVEQPVKKITEKDATLEYEDTYQVVYQIEPDSPQHNLEISVI